MLPYTVERVRGWHVVTSPKGKIVGVHATARKAERQRAAIERRRLSESMGREYR